MVLLLLSLACTSSPPLPSARTVTVQRGDTLSALAKEEGVTVADLKRWNGLTSDLIEVGQVLKVSDGPGTPAPQPAAATQRPRPRGGSAPEVAGTADGPTVPRLPPARPKKCLGGPDDTTGDEGMVHSQGLTTAGTAEGMNRILPHLGSCLVGLSDPPTSALPLEIHVGCDGLVDHVGIRGGHDWSVPHAECIQATVRQASFPAHALPDGDTFLYPLRFE